ncbi:bifunctional anthranilate synthase component I family protein/class IV aminotransferase, partial [Basilea psittacipulmonis]
IDWYKKQRLLNEADIQDFFSSQAKPQPSALLHARLKNSQAHFIEQIHRIHEHIRAGDVYQINYTDELSASFFGDPIYFYQKLRDAQPAPFASLMYHPDDGYTLCLSPECFLRIEGDLISTEPMKGTAPTPSHPDELPQAIKALQQDSKNRAENTMIVDLLRNDLSQLSIPFGVRCDDLFKVEAHGSVLQMTSKVQAVLPPHTSFAHILKSCFPCGSITGAPKRMAMKIIRSLENRERGLYTGSIGFLEPSTSDQIAQGTLNVVIRTICIQGHKATLGLGAGITIGSDAHDEYQECLLKGKFIKDAQNIGLIETMPIKNGRIVDWALHMARLQHSATALGIAFEKPNHPLITNATANAYRLHLRSDGTIQGEEKYIPPLSGEQFYSIWETPFEPTNALRRHKIDQRHHYDQITQWAIEQQSFDALIFNESGYLLEGSRTNVILQLEEGEWVTPSLSLDILPGIARQKILANPSLYLPTTQIIEHDQITRSMLKNAKKVILCNHLRGLIPVSLRN